MTKFIESYLENRSYFTAVRNTASTICQIKAEVPQGSILGPALFNIYISDIPFEYRVNINLQRRVSSSGIWRRIVRRVLTNVSEDHIASIFRVKEISSAKTSKQAGGIQLLKVEAISSSETSVETRRTTRRHIPEDDTLHNHRFENLKSYINLQIYSDDTCISVRSFKPKVTGNKLQEIEQNPEFWLSKWRIQMNVPKC
jgi:hypothetical protein